MATTAINNPGHSSDLRKDKPKVTAAVAVAVLLVVAAILGIVYLMYSDAPTTGRPGEIDNAEGVAPQQPPVTPVEPATPRQQN